MIQALLISSAIKIAAEFFPSLATKIAGKNAGNVAKQVVDAALSTASMGPNASVAEVIDKLRSDKQAQQELQIQLATLDAEEHERVLLDRQGARDYQLAAGVDGRKRANWMLGGVTLGLVVCIYLVAKPEGTVGPAALGLITTIAGALLKMFSDAFAFEFGSSRGSKDKSEEINKITDDMKKVGLEQTKALSDAAAANKRNEAPPPPPAAGAVPASGTDAPAPTEARPFSRMLVEGKVDLT